MEITNTETWSFNSDGYIFTSSYRTDYLDGKVIKKDEDGYTLIKWEVIKEHTIKLSPPLGMGKEKE